MFLWYCCVATSANYHVVLLNAILVLVWCDLALFNEAGIACYVCVCVLLVGVACWLICGLCFHV